VCVRLKTEDTEVIPNRRNFGLSNFAVAIRKSIAISSQKRAELH
jgi:hypothetical protein